MGEILDILVLEIWLNLDKELLYIINIYNTPIESEQDDKSTGILMKISKIL